LLLTSHYIECKTEFIYIKRKRIGTNLMAHEKTLGGDIGMVTGFYDGGAMIS
jgi:hypothetical protein